MTSSATPSAPNLTAHQANRDALLDQLGADSWDLCIVGGGINGAGVFRDAVLRGLKVCLIEKNDFGSGTSSRSSKLVHGGVRYLEQFEFSLVAESLSERGLWLQNAPHLVQNLTFCIPIYESFFELLKMSIGLTIYDALAWGRNPQPHLTLGYKRTRQVEPTLRVQGLKGSVIYGDCMTDDARMTLETILSGIRNGGTALSYCEATALEHDDSGNVVEVRDVVSGREARLTASSVVNVTGPWSDKFLATAKSVDTNGSQQHGSFNGHQRQPRLRPTKGVHLQFARERIGNETATVMFHPTDKRVLFCIPRGPVTIVGTTDTDFDGDPDHVVCTTDDADYLLEALNWYFPRANLHYSDVVSTYAGLRPLVNQEGVSESQVSREHEIHEDLPGVFSMVGGKLTTYRKMAEELLHAIGDKVSSDKRAKLTSPSDTKDATLFKGDRERVPASLIDRLGPTESFRLHQRYGDDAFLIADIIDNRPELAQRIDRHAPFIKAEIVYAARYEMVTSLTDLLTRRMSFFFFAQDQGLAIVEEASKLVAGELGWDEERRQKEVANYTADVEGSRQFRESVGDTDLLASK